MSNGFIYVMSDDTNLVKIGNSKNPNLRLKQLSTGNPSIKMDYLSKEVGNCQEVESRVHCVMKELRVTGEWFHCDVQHAAGAVRGEADKHGLLPVINTHGKEEVLASLTIDKWKQLGCSVERLSLTNYKIAQQYLEVDKTESTARLSHEHQYLLASSFFAKAYLLSLGFEG